ncbi:MAG: VOC family protein, partial [Streptosporangiaceae bacterium]
MTQATRCPVGSIRGSVTPVDGSHQFRDAAGSRGVVADAQHPQPPVQREHDRPAVRVGRVGHDPVCELVRPLAPDALGLRHVTRAEVPRRRRIGDQPLPSSPGVPAPSSRSSRQRHVTGSSPPRVRRNSAFDCDDVLALAAFWSAVLGRPIDEHSSEFFASIGGADGERREPAWYFSKVPEPRQAKNRVHADLVNPDPAAVDE